MASAMYWRKHSSRASSAPTTGRTRKVVSSAFVVQAAASSSGSPVCVTSKPLQRHHHAAATAAAHPGGALGPRCLAATFAAAQHARRRPLAPVVAALPAAAAAAAVHAAAAAVDGALMTTTKLVVPYHPTSHGQQLVLVGDCEALGNWDPKKGVRFTWCEGHSHTAEVELPIHSTVWCKLVVLSDNGAAVWEPDIDRELLLAPTSLASRAAGYTVLCHWGFPGCTQLLTNSLRRGGASATAAAASGRASGGKKGHPSRLASSGGDNPIIAGVKRALAHASSSRERLAVIPGIVSSWEEGPGAAAEAEVEAEEEEEVVMVQCQVTVLVPSNGPKLAPEQSLVLVGSSAALGRWDPANGLLLERSGEEESPLWSAQAELPLGEGLQAKVVVVDSVSGAAQVWEPCENRDLPNHLGATRPVMVTAYWGVAPTHCMEVDRLSGAAASSPQVVQLLRQQLAATSTQLDGLRRERDEARKVMASNEDHMRKLDVEATFFDRGSGRQEMVQLAEQLSTTRRLYETTKKEAQQLGGTVGVTRQLCDAAKRELSGLAQQLETAKRAYEALVPQVERMEKQLSSASRSFEATKPELLALEAQLERARGLFDRTLQKIETAKALSSGQGDVNSAASLAAAAVARRRGDSTTTGRPREVQLIRH